MKELREKEVKINNIAQQVKVFTANPDDLSSIPRIHMIRGEK